MELNLKCRINNKEYGANLVQGVPFSEEYNETLDSVTIVINKTPLIKNIYPFDDVYIYNGDFKGYNSDGDVYGEENLLSECEIEFYKPALNQKLKITLSKKIYNFLEIDPSRTFLIKILFQVDEEQEALLSYKFHVINGAFKLILQRVDAPTIGDFPSTEIAALTLTRQNNGNLVFDGEISNRLTDGIITEAYGNYIYKSENTNQFYRHFVIETYDKDIIFLGDKKGNKKLYKYTLNLCSETKKLETIPISEYSITQPQDPRYFESGGKKKSVYDCISEVIEMYSPVIKVADSDNTWSYQKKYKVSNAVKEKFSDVYAPDFTLEKPNLRDILSKLMIVQDCIPLVKDDIIYYMDITERHGKFNLNGVNFIRGTLSGQGYCEALKTSYSGALSQDNTCKMVEYMGFRDNQAGILSLSNLYLETKYPIYKIGKVYLCYYKKCSVRNIDENNLTSYGGTVVILCKQDITKLIKLGVERNLLSQNWYDLERSGNPPSSIEEMAKFKYCTLEYQIGSNRITGWGDKYTYFNYTWWDITKTTIENILKRLDKMYPWGIYNADYYRAKLGLKSNQKLVSSIKFLDDDQEHSDFFDCYVNPFSEGTTIVGEFLNDLDLLTTKSIGLKGLFFSVEYSAFFDGTIIHGKDIDRDGIITNDNQSSSLTILEEHGISQIEKANRLGNISYRINARYNSFEELQPLGSVLDLEEETDIIIYHREFSIYNNLINCIYYGAKDYVLKNYFTSVYAKHRPYNLLGYGESTKRDDNKKMYVVISKNSCFYEKENAKFNFYNFYNGSAQSPISALLSFIKPTMYNENEKMLYQPAKVDCGYIEFYDKETKSTEKYASDVNVFASGNSICFNIAMYDNATMGVGLDKDNLIPETIAPLFNKNESFIATVEDGKVNNESLFTKVVNFMGKYFNKVQGDLISLTKDDSNLYICGSQQKWYKVIDNDYTGYTKKLGFYIGHLSQYMTNEEIPEVLSGENSEQNAIDILKNKIFILPKVSNISMYNVIGGEYDVNKDNKEKINMTFQVELYNENKEEIYFSPWCWKLSDLLGVYNKVEKPTEISSPFSWDLSINGDFYTTTFGVDKGAANMAVLQDESQTAQYMPIIFFKIKKTNFENLIEWIENGELVRSFFSLKWKNKIKRWSHTYDNGCVLYTIDGNRVLQYTNNLNSKSITFMCEQTVKICKGGGGIYGQATDSPDVVYEEYLAEPVDLTLFCSKELSDYYSQAVGEDYYIFSNITNQDGITNTDPRYIVHYNNGRKYIRPSYFWAKNDAEILKVNYTYNSWDPKTDSASSILNWYSRLETITHDQYGGNVSSYKKKAYLEKIDDDLLVFMENNVASLVGESNLRTTLEIGKNIFVLRSNSEVDNSFVYRQYKSMTELNNILSIIDTNKKISDCMIIKDDDGKQYISISLKDIPTSTKSIQVWYLDNFDQQGNFRVDENDQITAENFKKGDQYFHFVFGVNLKHKEDGSFDESFDENGTPCVKIYLSLLSSKDKRVFDKYHNEIGKIENYLGSDKPYGKQQYYKKNT